MAERAANPLRKVVQAQVRGGQSSILAPFKSHWWLLKLECGHEVERRIRWKRIANPSRGWAAQHRGVSLERLPDKDPQRARCEYCAAEKRRG